MSEPPENPHARRGEGRFAVLVTLVFLGLVGLALSRHEPFRDEIQAWLIARDTTLTTLWGHLRYEGHPALWYLLLMPLTRVCPSPHAMQGLHLLISVAAVFVWVRFAPFTRLHRLLFAFSYFLCFEYAVISRNYAPGVLLCFVFCSLFAARQARPVALALVLALVAHTSAHAAIVATAAALAVAVEQGLRRRAEGQNRGATAWQWGAAVALVLAGLALAFLSVRPAVDSGYAPEWHLELHVRRMAQVLTQFTNAFLPLPQWRPDFWNTNVLYLLPANDLIRLAIALILVAGAVLALVATPAALTLFLVGAGGLSALFYVKYIGYLRHHGFLLIVFLMALWLRPTCTALPLPRPLDRLQRLVLTGWLRGGLALCLACQVVGAGLALQWDLRLPWSSASRVTDYLREHQGDRLLVGLSDWHAAVAAGPLSRTPSYYPRAGRFGTFVHLDTARDEPLSNTGAIEKALAVGRARGQECLFIHGRPLRPEIMARTGLREEAVFPAGIVSDEAFYLYTSETP